MKITNYVYKVGTVAGCNNLLIADTIEHRSKLMSEYNWKAYQDSIASIKPTGKTAVLYIGGAAEHHSLTRDYPSIKNPKGVMPVQSQMGFVASRVANYYGADYLSINANSCASSMYAFKEAKMLLSSGFDDVIIYGEEWVEPIEQLLFQKMGINLVVGDAFCIVHLQQGNQISDVSWVYNTDKNPFFVSKEGYIKAMNPFAGKSFDGVKTHGTGTPNNNEAEYGAIEEMFGGISRIEYKKEIGHTQGCSTMVEVCMLLDREKTGDYLVNASGLGNFYGSFWIRNT